MYDAKRLIGKEADQEDVIELQNKALDFDVIAGQDGECLVKVPNREPVRIEHISSFVLEGMKLIVEKHFDKQFHNLKAVVTVPAYFNNAQKMATESAAKIAGLELLRLITEPTAAAMAARLHEEESADDDQMVVVFDWGGGTFDISVLSIEKDTISVEAIQGDMNLGGRDLDELMAKHCLE